MYMQLHYVGDTHDFVKRYFLGILTSLEEKREFTLIPMITDEKEWTKKDREIYQNLISPGAAIESGAFSRFFGKNHDMFLDPDIGIAPASGARSGQHG